MIIDIHTHIFPPEMRADRQKYFSLDAAFELLYRSPKSKMIGAQDIVTAMDEQGVAKSVVFGFPWINADTFRRHNDYVIEAVSRFQDRLIGFGCCDPFHPEASREAQRCLENGLSGIGELAFYQSGIDEDVLEGLSPIMDLCRSQDRPVLIHANEPVGHKYPGKSPNTLRQIYELVRRFSNNKIILAHWGGGIFFFQLLKKEVKATLENVYYDTAASPFLYHREIYPIAIRLAGLERILLGSDFPLIKPSRYIDELKAAGLSSTEIESICGLNAKKLLNIK
jgi:predicted TIM-barrel fold metal-dependent hydrolase